MPIKSLIAEYKKSKRTSYLWLTIISSMLIPLILFLVYIIKPEYFIPETDVNPWLELTEGAYTAISSILFPFYIIIFISLITQIEHKNKMWKKIFVLPVRKETFFLSKLIFILIIIFVSLIMLDIGILTAGFVSGLFRSELNFLKFAPDFILLMKYTVFIFINVLGIVSIQYLLSLFFKHFILPVATGIFLTVTALILVNVWKGAKYFPYAFPQIYLNDLSGMIEIKHYGILSISEIVSLLTFVAISAIGLIIFVKQKVK